MHVASGDGLALITDAVDDNDPAILGEKPHHAGIELAYVSQFIESVANCFGQRLPVVLPIPKFCQTGDYCREIAWITNLQLVQKVPYGAYPSRCLIKLYYEIHSDTTSYLMYYGRVYPSQLLGDGDS